VLGSLALHRGVLFVGRFEKTAHVGLFDLETGSAIGGFSFRDERRGSSAAAGLAVDDDRRLFVADTRCSRVRVFTLFGLEIGGLGEEPGGSCEVSSRDAPGAIRSPVDVACQGNSEEGKVVVALSGERRNAVQVFDAGLQWLRSLRAPGRPDSVFRGIRGVALRGALLYVAEGGRNAIHSYRDGEFLTSFVIPCRGGRFEPQAVAPLDDGRMVIACGGGASAIVLVDGAGRLLRVLAEAGDDVGRVRHPTDVVVEERESDGKSQVIALDQDGERVQLFTLEGRCSGALAERA